jgi:hypothetical protein
MPEWCRTCGEPARRLSPGLLGKVVHAGSGEEQGTDGHEIAPTKTDPVRTAAAEEVEAQFAGRWECSAITAHYMAVPLRAAGTPVPVYADAPEELAEGIRKAESRWGARR